MDNIIENLTAFNRKERFYLVGTALGNKDFRLSTQFIDDIEKMFDLIIPDNYFSAMDYHLDWIYASLTLSNGETDLVYPNQERIIHASCEDIDFLVAYKYKNDCHIILLEAKGVTLFSNKQLQSKIARLMQIFGRNGTNWPQVIPHFAIVSPKEPQRIKHNNWPNWAKPEGKVKWIPLQISHDLKKVVRCNQAGKADKKGQYWIAKAGEN
ncbi:hypothetical protein ACFLTO_00330 [Chloroflexota bacterium]